MQPKLSFGSWAFSFGPFASAPWSFDRLCRFVGKAGYDGVEINGFRPHPHDEDFTSDADCHRLRQFIADCGLGISAYAPDLSGTPPAEAPIEYLRRIDSVLAFCERMQISLLRVDTVTPPQAYPGADFGARFAELVRTWRRTAERSQRAGVTVVWEFEPGFWLNRPSQVVRLLDEVNHPEFRVLFDTCHAYTGAVAGARHGDRPETLTGGAAAYAQLLGPRIGHVHVIDSDGSLHDNETSAHLPFGDGRIDFAAVLTAAEPALRELPWWTVDFCFCASTEQDAPRAVNYLRDLLDRLDASHAWNAKTMTQKEG